MVCCSCQLLAASQLLAARLDCQTRPRPRLDYTTRLTSLDLTQTQTQSQTQPSCRQLLVAGADRFQILASRSQHQILLKCSIELNALLFQSSPIFPTILLYYFYSSNTESCTPCNAVQCSVSWPTATTSRRYVRYARQLAASWLNINCAQKIMTWAQQSFVQTMFDCICYEGTQYSFRYSKGQLQQLI